MPEHLSREISCTSRNRVWACLCKCAQILVKLAVMPARSLRLLPLRTDP